MTRQDAKDIIYKVINGETVCDELKENLIMVCDAICENSFEKCNDVDYCKGCEFQEDDEDEDEIYREPYPYK